MGGADEGGFGLGLAQGVNRLAAPDPRWAMAFQAEAARLAAALGPLALAIEHHGSTAVPGLRAKPILDILVGLASLDDGARCAPAMAALGYDDAGRDVVPGHHIFGKGLARTHLVHMVEHGGPRWRRALGFRDALRADPALARDYEALKAQLALSHPNDRAAYSLGKSDFVEAVLRGAGLPGA